MILEGKQVSGAMPNGIAWLHMLAVRLTESFSHGEVNNDCEHSRLLGDSGPLNAGDSAARHQFGGPAERLQLPPVPDRRQFAEANLSPTSRSFTPSTVRRILRG